MQYFPSFRERIAIAQHEIQSVANSNVPKDQIKSVTIHGMKRSSISHSKILFRQTNSFSNNVQEEKNTFLKLNSIIEAASRNKVD